MKTALFAILVLLTLAVLIGLSGFVIMLLVNVVLNHYDIKPITWGVGCAISVLLGIITSSLRRNNNDS